MDVLQEVADSVSQTEPASLASDGDSSSTSEEEDSLFFGPMAGASIAEKRARWKKLLKGAGFFQASRRLGGKKWRIVENKPRTGRYAYANGYLFEISTKATRIAFKSIPRRLIYPGVYTTAHAV